MRPTTTEAAAAAPFRLKAEAASIHPWVRCHKRRPCFVSVAKEVADMRGAVAWILGIALAANGLVMLGAPAAWYAAVPGVAATGPFNAHFIRDIGVAYVLCGASLP